VPAEGEVGNNKKKFAPRHVGYGSSSAEHGDLDLGRGWGGRGHGIYQQHSDSSNIVSLVIVDADITFFI